MADSYLRNDGRNFTTVARIGREVHPLIAVFVHAPAGEDVTLDPETGLRVKGAEEAVQPARIVVTDDPTGGDSTVRLDGRVLASGYANAQEAIDSCAFTLTTLGVNVPTIWDTLEWDGDPNGPRWYVTK